MNIIYLLESWEERNWLLFFRLLAQFRRRLRKLVKLKTLLVRLTLFFAYLAVSRTWLLIKAVIFGVGPRELYFHVSPEAPSVSETEHNWHLKQQAGPNVFLR